MFIRHFKFLGILTIFIFICSMIPVNAVSGNGQIIEDAIRSELLKPLPMDYDINDPIVKHFHDKNPSMNIAMISKLIDSISQEQTVLGFNINLHDFWSDYLSNNQEHKYTIIGEQMTATEAVNKIPAYSSLINSFDRICDTVTALSDREQVYYIYYKYPTIQSIEKTSKCIIWTN